MKDSIFALLAAGIILAGCNKESQEKNLTGPVDIHEMNVNSSFDWNAAKTYSIEITGYANSVLILKDEGGNIIHKALLVKDEAYKTIIQVPAHHKVVTAEFLGNTYEIALKNSSIHYTLN